MLLPMGVTSCFASSSCTSVVLIYVMNILWCVHGDIIAVNTLWTFIFDLVEVYLKDVIGSSI